MDVRYAKLIKKENYELEDNFSQNKLTKMLFKINQYISFINWNYFLLY